MFYKVIGLLVIVLLASYTAVKAFRGYRQDNNERDTDTVDNIYIVLSLILLAVTVFCRSVKL